MATSNVRRRQRPTGTQGGSCAPADREGERLGWGRRRRRPRVSRTLPGPCGPCNVGGIGIDDDNDDDNDDDEDFHLRGTLAGSKWYRAGRY
jgi:hypothetical protein